MKSPAAVSFDPEQRAAIRERSFRPRVSAWKPIRRPGVTTTGALLLTTSSGELRGVLETFGPTSDLPSIDDVTPELGVAPKSGAELARLLGILHEHGVPSAVTGSGSRAEWGNPLREARVVIQTSGLDGIRELDAEEGVMCAGAGTPIATLSAAAEEAGWTFPLDPPGRATTLGGVLASDCAGTPPPRLRPIARSGPRPRGGPRRWHRHTFRGASRQERHRLRPRKASHRCSGNSRGHQ